MLNYWGLFFVGVFIPAMITTLLYLTYLCEKKENVI